MALVKDQSSKNQSSIELLSMQYELSMHIGQELELEPMLSVFFDRAFELLDCEAAYVRVRSNTKDLQCLCFPSENDVIAFSPFIEKEIQSSSDNNWCNIRSGYALSIQGQHIHIFRLGKLGIIALKRAKPFSKELVAGLLPIISKLAISAASCVRYEANLIQQRSTVRALEETIKDADFKDLIIKTIGAKFVNSVKEVTQLDNNKPFADAQGMLDILNFGVKLVEQELDMYVHLRDQSIKKDLVHIELKQLVENVISQLEGKARYKDVEMESFVDEGLPKSIETEDGYLAMALLQLMDNAVRYSDKGAVSLTVVAGCERNGTIPTKFEIADTGDGIVAAQLEKILSSDIEADGGITLQSRVTGLRLEIVKKLVASLGGKLSAKSVLGMGSTFSFEIPLKVVEWTDSNDNEAVIEAPVFEPAKTEVVLKPDEVLQEEELSRLALIAEDNPVNRIVAVKMLEKAGFTVVTATNGIEAIERWEDRIPDLILMDIEMPVMDGIQATLSIREQEKLLGVRTPVVALTSNMDKKVQERCFSVGVDYFLAKPLTPKILDDAIAQAKALALSSRPFRKISNL